jgi:tetratricopeptide (TPR) repeat protein
MQEPGDRHSGGGDAAGRPTYRAFISYSHADAAVAAWLLRRLEAFRVPRHLVGTRGRDGPVPERLGRFFRDREELASAGDLGPALREALAASSALVVVCSPAAARSRWVDAEVAAFRAARPDGAMLCYVVAGDPAAVDGAEACFPPALRAPGADGLVHEPLAADARPGADGRERALLKLVAGLLGVGFDDLARRDAQRRHRRLAWIAAAAVAGMSVTSALAVGAWVARNDAQRRQAQAEDLLGFMLGDLRAKLDTVGRLDLMRAVDDKATAYFATLGPADLSERTLEEQARSLTGIGQVRLQEGNHAEAIAAFEEAHRRAVELLARAPDDGQRLYDLGQAQFWIGSVAWQRKHWDEARRWLGAYRDTGLALAARDPSNADWQLEAIYGHHNLAVLEHSLGDAAAAERGFLAEREALLPRVAAAPTDTALRFTLADAESWLGSIALAQGRLAGARARFEAALARVERNRLDEPATVRWTSDAADLRVLLAEACAAAGDADCARTMAAEGLADAASLADGDPGNAAWRLGHAVARLWAIRVGAAPPDGLAGVESTLAALHEADRREHRTLHYLIDARVLLAAAARAAGDGAGAARWAVAAGEVADAAWAASQDEPLRLRVALTLIERGLAAREAGDRERAEAAWREADALLADPGGSGFRRLGPRVHVLGLLGRSTEARELATQLLAMGHAPLAPWPGPLGPLPAAALADR